MLLTYRFTTIMVPGAPILPEPLLAGSRPGVNHLGVEGAKDVPITKPTKSSPFSIPVASEF